MAEKSEAQTMVHDNDEALDPLGDAEEEVVKNRAKVGSARPSSLLYTYGPGSIMDLPNFSIMPAGLDDWEPIWNRRDRVPAILEPRLLKVVRLMLGQQVESLRPFPWQPKRSGKYDEGTDLGIPARVFPQWLRCTKCDYLGPLARFDYRNVNPFRPDLAQFFHKNCPRRGKNSKVDPPAVPAQHLLTCSKGHLDEFPYDLWVHKGQKCPKSDVPHLKMRDANLGKSTGSIIECQACKESRGMTEAQGDAGKEKLPQKCRGRHPHLNAFNKDCEARPTLIMMGASNLWFASIQSTIVMPRSEEEEEGVLADRLRVGLDPERLAKYRDLPDFDSDLSMLRDYAEGNVNLDGVDDDSLRNAVVEALAPPVSEDEMQAQKENWDPVDLLVPEWRFLQQPALFAQQQSGSGLMVTKVDRHEDLPPVVDQIVAVNKMKKVNAVLGFTRLDEMDRVNDLASRLVSLTRDGRPTWVPATEDRGEGVFIQLDLEAVNGWEESIFASELWNSHRQAHRRNFERRFSETAKKINPDDRLPAPRYWLLHTLSHTLIREMAMSSGYGAASLSERIYGWRSSPGREAAAGLLICTTASDSEGTLGGLVALSEKESFHRLLKAALRRASRCSSDPVCGTRTPSDPEDFLHGAACHSCSFASETSCEKANRFLDRRFLVDLPSSSGENVPGFFGSADVH